MQQERTIVEDTSEELPGGGVRWYRRYSDGFGVGGVSWPNSEAVLSARQAPASMERVSSSAIRRMEDAANDNDAAYLEARWDSVWASNGGE